MTLLDIHQNLVYRLEALGQGFSKDQNLKLERIEHLLDLVGRPQDKMRFIHVGGTSGKGSVSNLIMSILQKQGYKTGLFTSPYLQVINESCLVDAKLVDIRFFSELMNELEPYLDQVEQDGTFGRPSYFETLFALSLIAFERCRVEVAILEVGLGGMLDATNVVDADVSVLTSVGLDHIEILGTTIEEIAWDKVHIMKKGRISVCGFTQQEAQDIALDYSEKAGAKLYQIGKDFKWLRRTEGEVDIQTINSQIKKLSLEMSADFRGSNAALAVQACELFMGRTPERYAIEDSLLQPNLPGRGEILDRNPLVIIDGAHNPQKIEAALEVLLPKVEGRKTVVIYASKRTVGRDDKIREILHSRQQHIFRLISKINSVACIFTEFHTKGIWHSEDANVLRVKFQQEYENSETLVEKTVVGAFDQAKKLAGKEGAIVAIGSFHLAGEIRDLYYSKDELLKGSE